MLAAAELDAQLGTLASLAAPTAGAVFAAADFEKDDDYNFHIQARVSSCVIMCHRVSSWVIHPDVYNFHIQARNVL